MGNLNEIQKQTTQSYGDNSFTTTIKENTVEFDSAKDSFTFNDEVNVPSLKVNGQELTPSVPQKQADWIQSNISAVNYIKNKPVIQAGQGEKSIIEGDINNNVAGDFSHAEGGGTTASGYSSHAEGTFTTASGQHSHAEGRYTTAKNRSQHAFGEYNILDPSTALSYSRGNYIEIVGNGTTTTDRSNARTLDWSGNEMLTGTLTIGGASGATLKVESGALKVSFNGGTTWLTVSAS